MTFDFPENDIRMSQYIADKVVEIGRAMGGKIVIRGGTKRPYSTTFYQSTHNAGGAVMGDDPTTSATATCSAGTCPMCSASAPPPFRRTSPTTRANVSHYKQQLADKLGI
jgi:hypothetical protein